MKPLQLQHQENGEHQHGDPEEEQENQIQPRRPNPHAPTPRPLLAPAAHRHRPEHEEDRQPEGDEHEGPRPANHYTSRDAATRTMVRPQADEQREAEETNKQTEYVNETPPPLLVQLLVGELHEGVAHVVPLVREDALLDVELVHHPRAEVENHVRQENEDDEEQRNQRQRQASQLGSQQGRGGTIDL